MHGQSKLYVWEQEGTPGTGNSEAPVKVKVKNVLWIPRRPCRMLSTGTIWRDREFMDPGTKESYLRFRNDGAKITLGKQRVLDPVGFRAGGW